MPGRLLWKVGEVIFSMFLYICLANTNFKCRPLHIIYNQDIHKY